MLIKIQFCWVLFCNWHMNYPDKCPYPDKKDMSSATVAWNVSSCLLAFYLVQSKILLHSFFIFFFCPYDLWSVHCLDRDFKVPTVMLQFFSLDIYIFALCICVKVTVVLKSGCVMPPIMFFLQADVAISGHGGTLGILHFFLSVKIENWDCVS